MSNVLRPVEVQSFETVHPTPDILDALERDYPLEASVADLVDNSIDADARNVLIRFLRRRTKLVGLCIVDDGKGIKASDASRAMQFAARRHYSRKDLGMFGVGLKTASLSQADILIVASRARGDKPVGRRWSKAGIKKRDWQLEVLKSESASALLQHEWGDIGKIGVGTVVRWDSVYDFERLREGVDGYIQDAKVRMQRHLGLKLHRFLVSRKVRIRIDVEDDETGELGPPSAVEPLVPFPSDDLVGARGYPKTFTVALPGGGSIKARAHIWRKKSKVEGYRLGGGKVAEHQGFYFFRHDRLIQDGGWGFIGSEPHLSLARVEIDIPDSLRTYFKVQSSKTRVDVPATFSEAVEKSVARDGTTFRQFLKVAQETYRARGEVRARPMLRPGDGIPAEVRGALEGNESRFHRAGKCSVVWKSFESKDFIRINHDDKSVEMNKRYRTELLRGAHGGKTDVPLLRTLLYFTFESLLSGNRIGAQERLKIDAICAAMNASLKLEREWVLK